MGGVAVIGDWARVQGFALAGALPLPAETPEEARAQWNDLPADIAIVLITKAAAAALDLSGQSTATPMTVVIPE